MVTANEMKQDIKEGMKVVGKVHIPIAAARNCGLDYDELKKFCEAEGYTVREDSLEVDGEADPQVNLPVYTIEA